jgi:esterase/lipase superfamily enzyme
MVAVNLFCTPDFAMPNFVRTLAVLLIGILIGVGALALIAPFSSTQKTASAPEKDIPAEEFDPNALEPTAAGGGEPVEIPVVTPEDIAEAPMAPEPEPIVLPEPEDATYAVQRVFFGTNREIEDDTDIGPVFGYERGDALRVGFRDITIPKDAHDVGEIELPKSLTVFSITLWEEKEDPDRHFTVLETAVLSPDELQAMASEVARGAETYQGSAFVFIHGFNTTFRAAMFRAAQLTYDMGFDGPAFAFSWPSVGSTIDYVADLDAAENAAPHMDAFLDLVFSTPGVEKVHVIAHSMGNAALKDLLTLRGTKLSERNDKPIDQLILAAPDLDADVFEGIYEHFTRVAQGVTIYAASTDLALLASKSIRKNYVRLGDVGPAGPVVVPGVDTIDVSAVGTEILSLNHNIYARNRGVLDDLARLMLTGLRPPTSRMPTLEAVTKDIGTYWRIPE